MSQNLLLFYLWAVAAGCFLVALIRKAQQARPCWLFGHVKSYLTVTPPAYWYPTANCPEPSHSLHVVRGRDGVMRYKNCYVAHWVCRRCDDGAMGADCLGAVDQGAWKIEFERLVPDEKKWANGIPKGEELWGPPVAAEFWK